VGAAAPISFTVSTLAPLHPPRIARAVLPLAVTAGLIAFGLVVAVKPVLAVALVVAGVSAAAAVTRPQVVGLLSVLALGLVPVYAAPAIGPLVTHPSVLAAWLAAGGLLLLVYLGRATLRLNVVDLAMAALFGLFALAVLFEARERGEYITFVFTTLGPYLAMRLLMPRLDPTWLPRAFAAATLVSLPFVLHEAITATNLFASFEFNAAEAATWGEAQTRFGVQRGEGAFGQAISLSQFAGTAMLLALGAAVMTHKVGIRRIWMLVIVAGAAMMALSYSRTGWLVFGLGVVLIALAVTAGRTRARLLWTLGAAIALGGIALFVSGLNETVLRLVNDDSLEGSNDFRAILLERALRGDGIEWFGLPDSPLGAGIDGAASSIDNAYLAIAADWGWAGMIGLIGVGLAVASVLWKLRGEPWALIPAVTLANLIGLFQVAINTQTKYWLWMLVGACAGAAVARRPERNVPPVGA
jgi:hypothetical protein